MNLLFDEAPVFFLTRESITMIDIGMCPILPDQTHFSRFTGLPLINLVEGASSWLVSASLEAIAGRFLDVMVK